MKPYTQRALENVTEGSEALVIRNDPFLSWGEVKMIGEAIRRGVLLDKVVVSACQLSYYQVDYLLSEIVLHPSITKVDFSYNRIKSAEKSYYLLDKVASKNKRIHTFLLNAGVGSSLCLRELAPHNVLKVAGRTCFGNLKVWPGVDITAKKHDTLCHIEGIYDPPDETPKHKRGYKNLASVNGAVFDRNRYGAESLLKKIQLSLISSAEDAHDLQIRFPIVLYMAEQQNIRSPILRKILAIKAQLPPEYGLKFPIEDYMTLADRRALGLEEAPSLPKPSFGDRLVALVSRDKKQALLPALPRKTAEENQPQQLEIVDFNPLLNRFAETKQVLRAQLLANPEDARRFGEEALEARTAIALASLNMAGNTPIVTQVTEAMGGFLESFQEARTAFENYAKRQEPTWMNRARRKKAALHESQCDMRNLAEAGRFAEHAGKILEAIVPSVCDIEVSLRQQCENNDAIEKAYRCVSGYIGALQDVAHDVQQTWIDEAQKTIDSGSDGKISLWTRADTASTALTARCKTLEEVRQSIDLSVLSQQTQAELEEMQLGAITLMRGQNLPLLVEEATKFARQIQALQRAKLMNGVAVVTESIAAGEEARSMLAIRETAGSIADLAKASREVLRRTVETPPDAQKPLTPPASSSRPGVS